MPTALRLSAVQNTLRTGLACLALALSGCATMNRGECLTVDWRTIGYEDGVAGYAGDRIAQHRKACAKYGVTADLARYQEGRSQGLLEYCQPANGFRVGARGDGYGGICPAPVERAFFDAYSAGHQLFVLRSRVSRAERELNARRHELQEVEEGIARAINTVAGSDSNAEDRTQALVATEQLAEKRGRLRAEIRQLEEERARFESELEGYRASLAYTG
jgi:hypothetical protein